MAWLLPKRRGFEPPSEDSDNYTSRRRLRRGREQDDNLWAAGQVHDPNARKLVQYNLGRRGIDAGDIGFSYGKEV